MSRGPAGSTPAGHSLPMVRRLAIAALAAAFWMPLPARSAECALGFIFEIVRHPEGRLLWQLPVAPGDLLVLDYTHSSDGTPVRDIVQVGQDGHLVILEEQYLWYGSGLESHPQAAISFEGERTRVAVNRRLPHLLIRVGRVSNPVIRCGDARVALADLAPGGSLLQMRLMKR